MRCAQSYTWGGAGGEIPAIHLDIDRALREGVGESGSKGERIARLPILLSIDPINGSLIPISH
jgi:hypothetical protein